MAKTTAPKSAPKSSPETVPSSPRASKGRSKRSAVAPLKVLGDGNGASTVMPSTFPMPTGAFTIEQRPEPGPKRERYSFGKIPHVLEVPNLIELQKASFDWFKTEGLAEAFASISPIKDFTGNLILEFGEHSLGEPKYSIEECRERDMTYSAPLRVRVRLITAESGEIKGIPDQEIFMGDFPLMTDKGTFMINGAERVIVSQLVRSPGVYYSQDVDTNARPTFNATIIPNRGAWIEFETDNGTKNDETEGTIGVRIDKNRKIYVSTFIRALSRPELGFDWESDEAILKLFDDSPLIRNSIEKDKDVKTREDALKEIYKKLRPGEPENAENAEKLLEALFFDEKRYDLAGVGRYKLNGKFHYRIANRDVDARVDQPYVVIDEYADAGLEMPPITGKCLTRADMVAVIRRLIKVATGVVPKDDIDHLGNRRVRSVGELLQNQFRVGLLRLERVVRERMTVQDIETVTPQALINIRPVVAAIKEFFGSSQLSQFMDQTNSLAELTHKRRLSALGPGGLSRERAGFEVRDVHHSHYGRICPIETPEGPNIGLIGSLATYARVNKFGFIETPYRKVKGGKVTAQIDYLTADEEDRHVIAQANAPLDANGSFEENRVLVRRKGGEVDYIPPDDVDYMDVSPRQMVSVATAMIPFLEHDDANRALMGSNMQRQSVPLLRSEAPLVGTGMEYRAAVDAGDVILAEKAGVVEEVSADEVTVANDDGTRSTYLIAKFMRSNQGTCFNQKPVVEGGQRVEVNQVLADGPCTDNGEMALGKNLLVAFMPWEGHNYEDAIILSQRLVQDDVLSSIHIEEHEVDARDTKLGPEEITRDIPNVSEEVLADLDDRGIIRIGADVVPGDILVGKVTPKGETELTPEERLLRAIFGEKAREVRDTSLKVPHGEEGKVIGVRVFTREDGDELPPGVNQLVRVYVAQKRKITDGDKLAGRHGNKGVISKILPVEDMPFLADGTAVDIVLNPLGVPGRMNVGQVLETHLGWVAKTGWQVDDGDEPWKDRLRSIGADASAPNQIVATPVFDGAHEEEITGLLSSTLPNRDGNQMIGSSGKTKLFDGRTGEPFKDAISVGYIYILKLLHLVDDKIHARSTGPYSMITQQPLGGKAQFGGQRFGEMEVWALEAYGAAYALQELLTIKSDDVLGRVKVYEAIVKGENIPEPGIPESFKVLIKEMQSLALDVKVVSVDGGDVTVREEEDELLRAAEELGIDLRPVADRAAARAPGAQEVEEGADRQDEDGELTVPNDELLGEELDED